VSTKLFYGPLILSFEKILILDPVYGSNKLFLYLIGITSTLLVAFNILLNLSNSNFMELLMITIALIRKSAKPSIYGT